MAGSKGGNSDSIRNGVVGSLIAAGIIALVAPFRDFAIAVFKWLWGGLNGFVHHLGSIVSLPWWLFYLMVGLLVVAGSSSFRRWARNRVASGTTEGWLEYTTDEIIGLRWRWKIDRSGYPGEIVAFCPRCDLQDPFATDGYVNHLVVICGGCKFRGPYLNKTWHQLEDFIRREIQRRIRTGEWRKNGHIQSGV